MTDAHSNLANGIAARCPRSRDPWRRHQAVRCSSPEEGGGAQVDGRAVDVEQPQPGGPP